ncbi:hypothetical protein N7486_004411 [Penicillium sp. IBT 16267x]|nr:hypothetical protein N7486_004411 [Penicillium sp. IBT 16267x]
MEATLISELCKQRNKTLIPSLLGQHNAVLTGDTTTIDLSTAENWAIKGAVLEGLQHTLADLSEENLSYSSGIGGCPSTRQLMADLLNRHFHPVKQVDQSHLVLAAGGSFALTALVEQICDPGDGILIATPYWAGLDISISVHCPATIVPVHMPLQKFFCPESIQYYESAVDQASIPVKAVLVCNPNNPLGQCYPRETLQALIEFCKRRNLHYISDEVYALSVHRPPTGDFVTFISALELNDQEFGDRIHVIYSLSKDFGCNGIRVGALITQYNDSIRLSTALSVHSQVSTLSTALASKSILPPNIVEQVMENGGGKLREAYQVIRSFLEIRGMEFIPAGYGIFIFARLGKVKDIEEEGKLLRCLMSTGVSVSTGSSYHFLEPGWFRICYGLSIVRLHEGLRRIDLGVQNFQKCSVE